MPILVNRMTGGLVEAGSQSAENLVASGYWRHYSETPPGGETLVEDATPVPEAEKASDEPNDPAPSQDTTKAPSAAEVRSWARENGVDVPDKGRVPEDVKDAYTKAHENQE